MTGLAREADMEGAAETMSFRQRCRMMWQRLRSRFADAVAEAKLRGVPEDTARREAARALRADLRSLMSELLTRAPVPAIVRFLEVGRAWGEAGERLLGHHDAVLELVDSVYPRSTWTELESLDRQSAEDDARWTSWAQDWIEALGAAGPGGREALAGRGETRSTLRRWAPWLVSAATIFGATTVIVAATRE